MFLTNIPPHFFLFYIETTAKSICEKKNCYYGFLLNWISQDMQNEEITSLGHEGILGKCYFHCLRSPLLTEHAHKPRDRMLVLV